MKRSRKSSGLDSEIFERQSRICKSFANPTRLRILHLLGQKDCTASELQKQLSITLPNLSQHLAVLKAAGVVVTRRKGNRVICSLAAREVKQACQLIRSVLQRQIQESQRLAG